MIYYVNGKKHEQKIIAIDLDGVLATFSLEEYLYHGEKYIGKPTKGAKAFCWHLKTCDWKIIVFTSRKKLKPVEKWLDKNVAGHYDAINKNVIPIKTSGKIQADVYLDDRGMKFKGRFNNSLLAKIENFKPHWEAK